ncbi:MAG: hypothetical protein HYV06_03970 [Deltaproteobacteria bacterium]|nr:hypothetical protein [Deltaproteobacteria bacterium]
MRNSPPESVRFTFFDRPRGATLLPLPSRKMRAAGIVVGIFFSIFAAIGVIQFVSLSGDRVKTVFDLSTFLFRGFWLLGWSFAVLFLGAVTMLLLFFGESARIEGEHLYIVARIGLLKIRSAYPLSRISDVRVEPPGIRPADIVHLRFNYCESSCNLGDSMTRVRACQLQKLLSGAVAGRTAIGEEGAVKKPEFCTIQIGPFAWQLRDKGLSAPPTPVIACSPPAKDHEAPRTQAPVSSLALICANLAPLAGVLFLGWDVGDLMVLFWCQNAVIGFYNVLKLAVVGKLAALLEIPVFIAHFGAFMSAHFLFVYYMFIGGHFTTHEPAVREALLTLFIPLWPAILMMFISHGISFAVNFIGRREYTRRKVADLMNEPYKRVLILHITIVFGGWIVMLLKSPLPALCLLLLLKTYIDLWAHRKERLRCASQPGPTTETPLRR